MAVALAGESFEAAAAAAAARSAPDDGGFSPAGATGDPFLPEETTPLLAAPRRLAASEEERPPPARRGGGEGCSATNALALAAALLMALGTHYANHCLAPLKGPLIKSLGISNAAFGVLLSSLSLTKTVILLASGVFVSRIGVTTSALLICAVTVVGEAVLASASKTGAFLGMITGIVVYSMGSALVPILQEVIIIDRFHGKYFSTAIGLLLAASKAVDFLASGAAVMIVEAAGGRVDAAFWTATAMCAGSCVAVTAYAVAVRRFPGGSPRPAYFLPQRVSSRRHCPGMPDIPLAAPAGCLAAGVRSVLRFPDAFWLYILLSFLFGSLWHPYVHILSNLITVRYSVSDVQGAWQASCIYIMPALLNPFVGLALDRFGKRCYALIAAAVLLHLSLALILLPAVRGPAAPLACLSLALACGPLALKTIAAMLSYGDPARTAVTLGLHSWADQMGGALMDPIAGLVQDASPLVGGATPLHASSYTNVLRMLLVLSTPAIALSVLLAVADRRSRDLCGVLNASKCEWDAIIEKRAAAGVTEAAAGGSIPRRRWVYLCVGVALVVATWALFFLTTVSSALAER